MTAFQRLLLTVVTAVVWWWFRLECVVHCLLWLVLLLLVFRNTVFKCAGNEIRSDFVVMKLNCVCVWYSTWESDNMITVTTSVHWEEWKVRNCHRLYDLNSVCLITHIRRLCNNHVLYVYFFYVGGSKGMNVCISNIENKIIILLLARMEKEIRVFSIRKNWTKGLGV